MQEEVEKKTFCLIVDGGKISSKILYDSICKSLNRENKITARGKQSIKNLMDSDEKIMNVEVSNLNIKEFESEAKKFHIDYALKKDTSMEPPIYIVLFKAKDIDVVFNAFKSYKGRQEKQKEKVNINEELNKNKKIRKNNARQEKEIEPLDVNEK